MNKTIGAAIIVKNESNVIIRCLNSFKDIIDHITVCDTGSTDNTIEIIETYCKKYNIPYHIKQSSWVNFAVNRSEVVKLARPHADYTLLMDADEIFINKGLDKADLTADGYYIHYTGSLDFAQILLINNKLEWAYKSVTHEYIYSNEAKNYVDLKNVQMYHFYDGNNKVGKSQRDIDLLRQGIIDEPNNIRYHFYLAQSLKDIEQYQEAIEYYIKTINFRGWDEEGFYSRYQIGRCYDRLGKFNEAKIAYLKAWEFRPTRTEPLYYLAMMCRNQKEYNQAYMYCKKALEVPYPEDRLFVEKNIYMHLLLFEKSISAYWIGKYQESYDDCKKLLNCVNDNVPEYIKTQTRANIQFSEIKLFGHIITSTFNRENALENLKDVYRICNELKIPVFPFAGTLLGIIREDAFIAHDDDMDFGIYPNTYKPELIQALISEGFKLSLTIGKEDNGYELRFFKRNIQIDLFLFYNKDNYMTTYVYDNSGNSYEMKFNPFNLTKYFFKNFKIAVPDFPKDFLCEHYGPNWKTPNKSWNYLKDPANISLNKNE
jgi:glycosyltransferase involved in cell wall biosynthesis